MKMKKASELMTRPVISARENACARDIALQLISGLYSGMPVTNDAGKMVGIVTELDILGAVNDGRELSGTTAKEIMTPDVTKATTEATGEEMIKIMKEFHIIRLPIVKDDRLVGIVSRCDILKSLIGPEFAVHMGY